MLLIAATTFTLTSCGDDDWYDYDDWYDGYNWGGNDRRPDNVDEQDFWQQMAATIAGQWRGGMRAYELNEKGEAIDSVDFDTDIEFKLDRTGATYGTGTQYDFLTTNTSDDADYIRDFDWSINATNGDITIKYLEVTQNGNTTSTTNFYMVIPYDEMNLSQRTFTGYLYATDGSEVDDFLFNRYTESYAKAMKAPAKTKTTTKIVVRMKK